jgi:DMSO/TMAO reductase YedYZ molybdopterin-dependent catalytic subunit
MLEGQDRGSLLENSPVHPFARIVPLSKCLSDEAMVAFKLNNQFLSPRNGFPARALLAGWYGMDSVKWLRRIVVLRAEDQPEAFYRSGMNLLYSRILQVRGEQRISSRVSRVLVRSNIAFPPMGANLSAGHCTVWGFAWAGPDSIDHVEISLNAGRSWHPASLETGSRRFTWVKWAYEWQASPGRHTLISRARDSSGEVQPLARDPQRLDAYELNWCTPVHCWVK